MADSKSQEGKDGRPALSRMQMQVYAFMVDFWDTNDQLPPAKSIADHFGWSSANSAFDHLRSLERKGYIDRNVLGKYRFRRHPDACLRT